LYLGKAGAGIQFLDGRFKYPIFQEAKALKEKGHTLKEIETKLQVSYYQLNNLLKSRAKGAGRKKIDKLPRYHVKSLNYTDVSLILRGSVSEARLKELDTQNRQQGNVDCGPACGSFLLHLKHKKQVLSSESVTTLLKKQGKLTEQSEKEEDYDPGLEQGAEAKDIASGINRILKDQHISDQVTKVNWNWKQLTNAVQAEPVIALVERNTLYKPEGINEGWGHFIVILTQKKEDFLIYDPEYETGGYYLVSQDNLKKTLDETYYEFIHLKQGKKSENNSIVG